MQRVGLDRTDPGLLTYFSCIYETGSFHQYHLGTSFFLGFLQRSKRFTDVIRKEVRTGQYTQTWKERRQTRRLAFTNYSQRLKKKGR